MNRHPSDAVYIAEAALRDSQDRLRALSEASFEAIFFSDKGICVDQNLTAAKLFGYSLEEALGRPGTDWIVPEERERVGQKMLEGEQQPYRSVALRKDGSTFPCEIQARKCDYEGQRIRVTSLRDITRQIQAEEALQRSEARNRALIDATPDLLFLIDSSGHFVDFEQGEGFLLVPPEQFLGRHLSEIMPRDVVQETEVALRKVLSTGQVQRFEYELEIEGHLKTFDVRAAASASETVLFIVRDITENRRLEAIRSRAERLETAGRIAGQVAHDFNNMLAPLLGYPELVREELPEGHPAIELLLDMENSARKMASINQQLLVLGRRGHYAQAPLDLNAVVTQAIREFQPLLSAYEVELDLDEDLMLIMGGEAQLQRAILNLIQNATDAMNPGGTVRITTRNFYVDEQVTAFGNIPSNEYVKLTFTDEGCGIPEGILHKIFDPFFTTKEASRTRGSGLGLSVVNGVVEDHEGYVDLSTRRGQGTAFYLYFPITRLEAPVKKHAELTGDGETILVVDDDRVQREVSQRLLTRLGYQVDAVSSGEEGVELLQQAPRDLLILDMVMPDGIDGAETYHRILQIRPGQKALIVSGYSENARVAEARRLGATGFVRKPMTMESIGIAVKEELEKGTQIPL